MTKEELKKEAEEYAEQCYGWCNNDQVTDVAIATYITSAEPREKRIADLENKIADIKANCDLAIEGRDIKINELEERIEKMKCWCNCKNYLSCLEECCRKNISFEKGICYNCKKWEIKE